MAQATNAPPVPIPPLAFDIRVRLSIMMFLEFAIWGAWFVVLNNYTAAMGFSATAIGSIYATMPLGAIFSTIFIGQIADRYFSSERLLAALQLIGAGLLFLLAQISDPATFYWVLLVYSLVYSPTLSLVNSVAFTHIPDATRDFPGIRVLGTIGWIAVGMLLPLILVNYASPLLGATDPKAPRFWLDLGGTLFTAPLLIAAGLSLLMAAYSLALPHTPPPGKPGDALPFVRAFSLMKEFSFAVFYTVSFVITIVLAFYYAFASLFLEKSQGVPGEEASAWMTIGQWAEMLLLPFLPLFLRHLGMKWVLALGMLAWGIRYLLFALGGPWPLIVLGVALHGICFDFFFAAGFIHVDNKAPREIRASGQALFAFLTYGLGMYIGSELSGHINALYTHEITDSAGTITKVTDWSSFWLVPAVGVLVSFLVFAVLFRDKRTESYPADLSTPEAA